MPGLPAWRQAGDRGQLRKVPKIEALARQEKAVQKNQFLECDVYKVGKLVTVHGVFSSKKLHIGNQRLRFSAC